MKTTTSIISFAIALIVGAGVGYFLAIGTEDHDTQTKKLQDSITMMKEQATDIQKMAELMKSSGSAMQEMGMKYKDDDKK